MSYSSLALRGAFWSLLQMFAEKSTQAIVMLVAALFLGPHDFGLAAMATAPAIIIASTLQSGSQLIVQRDEFDQSFLNSAFSLFVLIGLASAALIIAISTGFYYLPGYGGAWQMVLPTMIAPVCAAVGVVPEGILVRNFAYRVLTIRKTIGQALAGILCCGMAVYGLGAWSIVVQVTLAPLISTTISLVAVRWRPTAVASIAQIRTISRFSGAVLGISALNQINVRSVDVIVGIVAGPSAAGVFRLGRTILDLATSLFLNPVNSTLLPIFSRISGDRERIVEAMWQACGVASLVASVPFIASSFAGSYVANLVFSNDWPNLPTTVTLMLISLPFMALIVPLQTYLLATGQARLAVYNNLYQTVVNLVMISAGAYYGIIWAAFAVSLRYFVGGISLVFTLKRVSPEIKLAKEVVTSMPAVVGFVVVLTVGAIAWLLVLDLTRPLPVIAVTTMALLLYAGFAFILFRERIERLLTLIRAKN